MSGSRTGTGAGSPGASSRSNVPTASPSTAARPRHSNGFSTDATGRRWSSSLARHLRQICERPEPRLLPGDDALARYDDNRNGRITCKEARRHRIAPVPRSHPAYRYMRDGDGDGVVCE